MRVFHKRNIVTTIPARLCSQKLEVEFLCRSLISGPILTPIVYDESEYPVQVLKLDSVKSLIAPGRFPNEVCGI